MKEMNEVKREILIVERHPPNEDGVRTIANVIVPGANDHINFRIAYSIAREVKQEGNSISIESAENYDD
jgi:hypothetical protein